MDILRKLTLIALRPFVDGSCSLAGMPDAASGPDLQIWFLHRLFSERAAALDRAARDAAVRAWKGLETALAGETFWGHLQLAVAPPETRELILGLRTALESELRQRTAFREQCVSELQAARRANHLLAGTTLRLDGLAREAVAMQKAGDATHGLFAEWNAMQAVADALGEHGYRNLTWLLGLGVAGRPLLAELLRHFFHEHVETDPAWVGVLAEPPGWSRLLGRIGDNVGSLLLGPLNVSVLREVIRLYGEPSPTSAVALPSDRPRREGLPCVAYAGREPFIFVSYAHRDRHLVYPEIARLYGLGYRIWYDEGINPGREWPEDIARALLACSFFLAFLSPRAVESRHVRNEIHFALGEEKPFLAVYLEETTLPGGLRLQISSLQAIEKHRTDVARYARLLESSLPPTLRTIRA